VLAERGKAAPHELWIERGQIPLQIDHDLKGASRIEFLDGLEHPV
jgi:hypothetical protein